MMAGGEWNRRRFPNAGDILHIIQIGMLLAAGGVAYAKFDAASRQVIEQGARIERMEHYLSSKDQSYWKLSKESE